MRRYYKSSGDTASFSDDEDDDDTDSDDDEDEDTDSDGDSSYSKGDSDRRCGGCEGGDRCGSQGSCFDGTVLGSVAPGREHKRQGDAAAAARLSRASPGVLRVAACHHPLVELPDGPMTAGLRL